MLRCQVGVFIGPTIPHVRHTDVVTVGFFYRDHKDTSGKLWSCLLDCINIRLANLHLTDKQRNGDLLFQQRYRLLTTRRWMFSTIVIYLIITLNARCDLLAAFRLMYMLELNQKSRVGRTHRFGR